MTRVQSWIRDKIGIMTDAGVLGTLHLYRKGLLRYCDVLKRAEAVSLQDSNTDRISIAGTKADRFHNLAHQRK